MHQFLRWLFEPGIFSNGPVRVALIVGGVVAITSAIVGTFTVIRSQSFGGHALSDVSTAGGSAALLLGFSPLTGFVLGGIVGAGAMNAIGSRQERGRDLATGIVLGASTGLASLFLYLVTTSGKTIGATQQILFGSIFITDSSTVPLVFSLGGIALILIFLIYRPLIMTSTSIELAQAKGIPVWRIDALYMLALALAVGLSSLVIGAILSTALLIGPPAAALRVVRRIRTALLLACFLGVLSTSLGVVFAYDSYDWIPSHRGIPVSFFVVSVVFTIYVASDLIRWISHRPYIGMFGIRRDSNKRQPRTTN